MVVGLVNFFDSKMIVEFFWSLGLGFVEAFAKIFEISFVASLTIIRIFFECLPLSPIMRIVDSFSDARDFVESMVWIRPPKKPPDKSHSSVLFFLRFD